MGGPKTYTTPTEEETKDIDVGKEITPTVEPTPETKPETSE